MWEKVYNQPCETFLKPLKELGMFSDRYKVYIHTTRIRKDGAVFVYVILKAFSHLSDCPKISH
jgi:hypothetical protein